jgi:hypothetical protein
MKFTSKPLGTTHHTAAASTTFQGHNMNTLFSDAVSTARVMQNPVQFKATISANKLQNH